MGDWHLRCEELVGSGDPTIAGRGKVDPVDKVETLGPERGSVGSVGHISDSRSMRWSVVGSGNPTTMATMAGRRRGVSSGRGGGR